MLYTLALTSGALLVVGKVDSHWKHDIVVTLNDVDLTSQQRRVPSGLVL